MTDNMPPPEEWRAIPDFAGYLEERLKAAEQQLADIRKLDDKAFANWQKQRSDLQERVDRAEQQNAELREEIAQLKYAVRLMTEAREQTDK